MAGTTGRHESAAFELGYQRKWRAFAWRRGLALTLLYGWVPFCCALFLVSRLGTRRPVACVALMAAWLCGLVAAIWWAGDFRCPRCSRRYASLGRGGRGLNVMNGLFDRVCSNCQLTKFERIR